MPLDQLQHVQTYKDVELLDGVRRRSYKTVRCLMVFGVILISFTFLLALRSSPYMDEFFHTRQTQVYCFERDIYKWDNKITTLPGVYGVGVGMSHVLSLLSDTSWHLLLQPTWHSILKPLGSRFSHQFIVPLMVQSYYNESQASYSYSYFFNYTLTESSSQTINHDENLIGNDNDRITESQQQIQRSGEAENETKDTESSNPSSIPTTTRIPPTSLPKFVKTALLEIFSQYESVIASHESTEQEQKTFESQTKAVQESPTGLPAMQILPYIWSVLRDSWGSIMVRGDSSWLKIFCSTSALRFFVNPFMALFTLRLFHLLLSEQQQQYKQNVDSMRVECWLHALRLLVLFTFPVSFFFHFMYYTDTGSVMMVMWMWREERRGKHWRAAVLGALSFLFRQTNIIWIAFVTLDHLLRLALINQLNSHLEIKSNSKENTKSKEDNESSVEDEKESYISILSGIFIETSFSLLTFVWSHLLTIVWNYVGQVLLMIGFAMFVVWNEGSITVGDRTAHQPTFHAPQLLYFLFFSCLFLAPLFIFGYLSPLHLQEEQEETRGRTRHRRGETEQNPKIVSKSGKHVLSPFFSLFTSLAQHLIHIITHPISSLSVVAVWVGLMVWAVMYKTMAHPYLLADNRHFTFYFWHRTFLQYSLFKYYMIPIYYLSGWMLTRQLQNVLKATFVKMVSKWNVNHHRHLKPQVYTQYATCWVLMFLVLASFSLIPSPLFEFRYFITPILMVMVMMLPEQKSILALTLQLIFQISINFFCIYIFIFKPFTWNNETEPIARFMW